MANVPRQLAQALPMPLKIVPSSVALRVTIRTSRSCSYSRSLSQTEGVPLGLKDVNTTCFRETPYDKRASFAAFGVKPITGRRAVMCAHGLSRLCVNRKRYVPLIQSDKALSVQP